MVKKQNTKNNRLGMHQLWLGIIIGLLLCVPVIYFGLDHFKDELLLLAFTAFVISIILTIIFLLIHTFKHRILNGVFGVTTTSASEISKDLITASKHISKGNVDNAIVEIEPIIKKSVALFSWIHTSRRLFGFTIAALATFIGSVTLLLTFAQKDTMEDQTKLFSNQLIELKIQNESVKEQNSLLKEQISKSENSDRKSRVTNLIQLLYSDEEHPVTKSIALKELLLLQDYFTDLIRFDGLNLNKAYLPKVNLSNFKMNNSVFSNADFNGAVFDNATLFNVDFRDTSLVKSSFSTVDLRSSNFSSLNSNNNYLFDIFLGASKLQNANFSDSNLQFMTLSGSTMKVELIQEPSCSVIKRTGLVTGFDLGNNNNTKEQNKTNFKGAVLWHTKLAGIPMNRIDFSDTELTKTSFYRSNGTYTNFSNSKMLQTQFMCSNYIAGNFQNSLINGDFRNAILESTKWQGAELEYANFAGADLRCSDFSNVVINKGKIYNEFRINLSSADLRGSIGITKAMLENSCGDSTTRLPKKFENYELNECKVENLISNCSSCPNEPYPANKPPAKNCANCVDCDSWPMKLVYASNHMFNKNYRESINKALNIK